MPGPFEIILTPGTSASVSINDGVPDRWKAAGLSVLIRSTLSCCRPAKLPETTTSSLLIIAGSKATFNSKSLSSNTTFLTMVL